MSAALLPRLVPSGTLQLVDIGARGGPHARWNAFSHLLEVVGFEPEPEECERLNAEARRLGKRWRYLPHALADRPAARTFFVCRSPGCSSLYEPNTPFVEQFDYAPHMEIVRRVTLPQTTTLDAVAASAALTADCMKIDCQGAELEILRGGVGLLRRVLVLEMEVGFNPQYKDQPLFADLDAFMRSHGFSLLGLRRTCWRRKAGIARHASPFGGQVMHGDALYYNERALSAADAATAAKLLVCLAAYRQHDLLVHTLWEHAALRTLTEAERETLLRELIPPRPLAWRLLSTLVGRLDNRNLRRVTAELRADRAVDWHDADFF